MNERREFTRISRPLEVDIASDRRIQGTTQNVSMKGLLVSSAARHNVGTTVRCIVYIDGRDGVARVTATGRIVRSTNEGLAIDFHDIEGLESLEHWRQLLLLNAGDRLADVERELAEHVGLRPR
jgi:hypothetical protein